MRIAKVLFICLLLSTGGCSPYTLIQRDIFPDNRPEAEILNQRTALIRTAESDISIVSVSKDQWKDILSSRALSGSFDIEPQDIMPADLFFIILTNTTEALLTDISLSCSYSDINIQMLNSESFYKLLNLSVQKNSNNSDILSVRRLTSQEYELDKIDFSKSTLIYPFSFVLPLDRICFLAAFPPIPKDQRHFIISLTYSTPAAKKKVDFKFTRFEHREEE